MKIKISAKKFMDIVEDSMIKKSSVTLISDPRLTFMKGTVLAANSSSSNDVASVLLINSTYFDEYECSENETIIVDLETRLRLTEGFKNVTTFETTNDQKLLATDGVDNLDSDLMALDDKKFVLPLTKTKYGLLPDKNKYIAKDHKGEWTDEDALKGFNIYKTTAEALKVPSREHYDISMKNKKLVVHMPGTTTKLSHTIEGEAIQGEKGSFIIDGEFYQNIISNLSGEVYLIYNKAMVIFAETTEKIMKSYAAATRVDA